MSADIVPIRNEQQRRRQTVEASLREAARWIDAALQGQIPIAEGVCTAHGALLPAIREVVKAEIA